MSLNRFLVERHGLFQFALHLAFIGLLEELPRLAFILFVAFALDQKILNIHSAASEKRLQRRSRSFNQLNVLRKVRLVDFTSCGLAGDLFEKPQEMGLTIRSSASF
jgi:hypothetical protein